MRVPGTSRNCESRATWADQVGIDQTGLGNYSHARQGNYFLNSLLAVNKDQSFGDLTLRNHAIVVHGQTVDGEYKVKRPVACGTLSR